MERKKETGFSCKSKTYKVNYFAALGKLFTTIEKDIDNGRHNPLDSIPGREGKKDGIQTEPEAQGKAISRGG